MAANEINGLAASTGARRRLLVRWALAGLLIPIALGALSWLCFEAQIGTVFDASANLAMFAAPFSPFVLKAFQGRDIHGALPYAIAGGVVLFNAALYGAVGMLHWRLRAQSQVNQMLWLTLVIGIGFSLLKFAALIAAFARG